MGPSIGHNSRPSHPLADESVTIGGKAFQVWPDAAKLHVVAPGFAGMLNPDVVDLKSSMVDHILGAEEAASQIEPPQFLGSGGQKIRNLASFGDPFFELIDKRARLMYMLVFGREDAVVDDCWANIFRDREWANAHSHKRAEAAVVLSLVPTPSDEIEHDFTAGQFYIADPRVKQCCPVDDGYVSDLWMPMHGQDCMLMIFPGIVTHGVHPHQGDSKRITIAWNINAEKLPGEVTHDGDMSDWKEALQKQG